MVMISFEETYRKRRVLVTGHTGFKGSWLTLWLTQLGAEVTGISLSPKTEQNHWNLLKLKINDCRADIRNIDEITNIIKRAEPEIIFHLAAQPLVKRSYDDPITTWDTNLMGTLNILEAARHQPTVKAIIVVTTDKCYENHEWPWGYRETDALGGYDPYSASKAASEILVDSYRRAFFNKSKQVLIATARAGNVIGGGDWSDERLVPDIVNSIQNRKPIAIRSPHATRPWQHVLESIHAYLILGKKLIEGNSLFGGPWNFGPQEDSNQTVLEVLNKFKSQWPILQWYHAEEKSHHEGQLLNIDSSKAKKFLSWRPVWNMDKTILKTVEWYREWMEHGSALSSEHLNSFISDIKSK